MTAPVASFTTSASKSRRALLAGALGGIGAWAASAVGRASPVRAEGEAIVVGGEYNTATSVTRVANTTTSATVLMGQSLGAGIGVHGWSTTGYGVYGTSSSGGGVRGDSSSSFGVIGSSTSSYGIFGTSSSGIAVGGLSGTGPGVLGRSDLAHGVRGVSTAGVGLYGQATSGFALRTSGRTKFSTSGLATINAGSTSKTVTPGVNVTADSFVLLTPKANIGSRALWFTTNATDNKFTIRMSSSRSSNTPVAWLLLG